MKLKKVSKNLKKVPKNPKKYLFKAYKELLEEAEDFFDDFLEDVLDDRKIPKLKKFNLYGAAVMVRPAYIFAERVENLLKVIFGFSMVASGVMATFLGFTRTSELLYALIDTIIGRVLMVVIGISYLIIGLWKILHIKN